MTLQAVDEGSVAGGGVTGCSGLEHCDPLVDPPLWWLKPFVTLGPAGVAPDE